jgi:sugar phosphate isomerase/epimerase
MAVELGLTPDSRWDTDLGGLVDAAQQAGFSALGVAVGNVDGEAAARYDAAGLRCHEVLALLLVDDADATVSYAAGLAEAAAAMHADWVLTTFRTGLDDRTAPVIRRCAEMFADAGAKMAVEFSPLGPVTSIARGLEIVDVAGVERAGLLVDTWHFSHGESTWDDLERVPLERLAYIQFDDALEPLSDDAIEETMYRRAMPGDGVLELDRFATTLLERGYDGLVSVEVLNRELREVPVAEVARRAHDSTARYWR